MKILVTGGAGFIGSHVCDFLVDRKDFVVAVDNFNDYYDPKVKESNVKQLVDKENFVLVKEDIRNNEKTQELFQKHNFDKIIHIAAMAGVRPSIEKPELYNDVNVNGTLVLLELAKKFKIKNFIYASSSSIYGTNEKTPFSEDDEIKNIISPYALTKRACELYCKVYHELFGMKITCLRFFTVYGERGRPDMAPYLFTKWIDEGKTVTMFGDGTSARDYTYIDDIIQGVIAALDKDLDFEIINLGESKTTKLKDFIAIVENLLGKKANIEQKPMFLGDVPITFADVSKAKRLLGYNPSTTVEDGMKKFVEWYKENKK